ncbi:Flp pilus assembly protein TadG [Friedmanniella endophytica]|uniref:Flp pilus assembly protein TadG n=1 Tax=Microlunatus kandeliicorticis TaxID=1759536 RepID=A0A7W3IPS4_9ACTN|nr:TadE family protein [Microlunatus kandeliicorticis]MBA8793012.1 Flp pilus assembly protein TadG [Microlunatus kandeliicorticis]
MDRTRTERGAAAVEFALVAPLLILLVVGITQFGRAYAAQAQLTNAARQAARTMALQSNVSAAQAAAQAAAPTLNLTTGQISVTPSTCTTSTSSPTATAVVTINYPFTFLASSMLGGPVTLHGRAVMRCNG